MIPALLWAMSARVTRNRLTDHYGPLSQASLSLGRLGKSGLALRRVALPDSLTPSGRRCANAYPTLDRLPSLVS